MPKHLPFASHLDPRFMIFSALPELNPLAPKWQSLLRAPALPSKCTTVGDAVDHFPPSSVPWQYPPWQTSLGSTRVHLLCHPHLNPLGAGVVGLSKGPMPSLGPGTSGVGSVC